MLKAPSEDTFAAFLREKDPKLLQGPDFLTHFFTLKLIVSIFLKAFFVVIATKLDQFLAV